MRSEGSEPVPRFAYSIAEAAHSLGMSKPVVYRLIEAGTLRTFQVGTRRLVTRAALAECVVALEANGAVLPSESPSHKKRPER